MIRAGSTTVVVCLLAATDSFAANFNVTNTNASGPGSLAQAITSANATVAADTISFQFLGLSEQIITADLPAVTQPVTIDGYTQLFSSDNSTDLFATNANILVILDGSTLPAGEAVLQIDAGPTTIRGLEIRGIQAQGYGIRVGANAQDVSILGCFIGTDGTADRSSGTGIRVDGTATIGTELEQDRNLISGNDQGGIVLRGPSSDVRNNLIGGTAAGGAGLANGAGVIVTTAAATGNNIGASVPAGQNSIHENSLDGIRIESSAGDGNAIRRNWIDGNGGLGIDLEDDGVTLNDVDDLDDGPNHLQNFPELSFARTNGMELHVDGMLNSRPGDYEVVVYLAVPGEPSGFGEGSVPLGSFPVTIGQGETTANFSVVIDLDQVPGEEFDLTATARETESEDSSEFSRQLRMQYGGPERVVTNTNDSGDGSLRAALETAKDNAFADTIIFQIPGPGPHTIKPLTPLVVPTQTIVDGYTQALYSQNTLVEGSNADIRIAIDGSLLPANASYLIGASGSDLAIRGLSIHSSPSHGIYSLTGFRHRIEGNFIGMDPTGEVDLGNNGTGVHISDVTDVLVGGPSRAQRNVVSGNQEAGITTLGLRSTILNNIVGLSASLKPGFGNGWDGVMLSDADARVGSDEPGFGNVIFGNASSGIALLGSGGNGNEFLGNSIDDNGELGIDLQRGLVHVNDANDEDVGANNLQNFPVLQSVSQQGDQVHVEGVLDLPSHIADDVYTIRVFASPTCNVLGHGEGAVFLGKTDVVLSGDDEHFAFSIEGDLGDGAQVTATATDRALRNTSEFSACFEYPVPEDVLCGDVNEDGSIAAGDALGVLKAAVGSASCANCVCNVNNAGGITTTDALFVLRKAVGQNVPLNCPDCN